MGAHAGKLTGMRVLLTGATGFVGSHVVPELIRKGHEVLALVRSTSQYRALQEKKVELVFGSLSDAKLASLKLPPIDAVIHVGGIIKAKNPEEFYQTNAEGTRALLEAVSLKPIQNFVYVSSISARGPVLDNLDASPDRPVSHYGKSKLRAEAIVSEPSWKFPRVIIRPPIVYGPGDRETLAFFKMFKLGYFPMMRGGERKTSFIFVEDLARILVKAVETPLPKLGTLYPDDGNRGYSWQEVIQIAESLYGHKIKRIGLPLWAVAAGARFNEYSSKMFGHTPMFSWDKYQEMKQVSWICDSRELRELFPIESYTDLKTGFTIADKWYRNRGWL